MDKETVVETINGDVEIVLDTFGFYARCKASNCTWVSDNPTGYLGRYAGKYGAIKAAQDHLDN